MNSPLVDTSVLVDFFAARASPEADLLDLLLEDGPPPAIAPIILQEFMQGLTRPSDVARGREYLDRFLQIPPPDYGVHEAAAAMSRALRRQGVTSGTADALIVAIAERAGVALLTSDGIQMRLCGLAGVTPL
jgi:predicted nucleic acid-binding protein